MRKRYQVFICSTYTDLRTERQTAVEAVLKAGHIPAGMELFTAGDKSQMDVIQGWIDDSDIFMLILGARYGTIEPVSGLSYVETEFDYARSIGKPFFSVVLSDEGKEAKVRNEGTLILEQQNEAAYRLFREKVKSQLCAFFANAQDVKVAVLETLPQIIVEHPELVGWVSAADRNGEITDKIAEYSKQITDLQNANAKLQQELEQRPADNASLRLELRKNVATLWGMGSDHAYF